MTLRADQGILNENLATNRGSVPSKTGCWEPDPSNPDGIPYYFPLARSELGSTEVRRKRLQIALQVLLIDGQSLTSQIFTTVTVYPGCQYLRYLKNLQKYTVTRRCLGRSVVTRAPYLWGIRPPDTLPPREHTNTHTRTESPYGGISEP